MQNPSSHTGILLTNTGSPSAPTPEALRPYLNQFLSDPRVVDYPRWLWQPLLQGIILRTRPRRSARLYQKIWTLAGSPLITTVQRQAEGLRTRLGGGIPVRIGMRYGKPSIASGLRELRQAGVTRLIIFPLFPQFTQATTTSTFDAVEQEICTWPETPDIRTVDNYHDDPAYLNALANSIREAWTIKGRPDKLLFSFHGIPERYLWNGDPYQEQCKRTAKAVAETLRPDATEWQIAFQSRFGPEPWLRPYTDQTLKGWGESGVKNVHVICPGFSADCLETLDEIGREARHTFLAAGGTDFHYIPALNDRPDHLDALAQVALTHLQDHAGSSIVNFVPWPASLSTSILPP